MVAVLVWVLLSRRNQYHRRDDRATGRCAGVLCLISLGLGFSLTFKFAVLTSSDTASSLLLLRDAAIHPNHARLCQGGAEKRRCHVCGPSKRIVSTVGDEAHLAQIGHSLVTLGHTAISFVLPVSDEFMRVKPSTDLFTQNSKGSEQYW